METKPYKRILESLKSESDLLEIVKNIEECFYLDYKRCVKDDYSDSRSLKGADMDNIAKSISGFGNALGGLLIFGVNNDKSLNPFKGFKNFEMLVQESVSRSTNPRHEKIETLTIESSEKDMGFVIIIINQSSNRPLQVITNSNNHRYFYRSGESHNDIPHDVLVGMLGYKIPVKLTYQFQTDSSETEDDFSFNILIRNKSSLIARDLYFNIDIGMPNVKVERGNSLNLFEGNILSNSISIITKNDYRVPPQGYVSPITIKIPKTPLEEERDYHFYFTFGCEGSKINEFNSEFKGKEFNKYTDKPLSEMIKFLQDNSPGHVIERS